MPDIAKSYNLLDLAISGAVEQDVKKQTIYAITFVHHFVKTVPILILSPICSYHRLK